MFKFHMCIKVLHVEMTSILNNTCDKRQNVVNAHLNMWEVNFGIPIFGKYMYLKIHVKR